MENIINSFKYIILILLLMRSFDLLGQKSDQTIESKIVAELNNVRQGESIKTNEVNLSSIDPKAVLNSLKKFKNDPSNKVRFAVQTMQYKVAIGSSDLSIRREVTDNLVSDCYDSDLLISQQAARRLLSFRSVDFSNKSKKLIGDLILKNGINNELILISGVAQIREQIPRLKALSGELNKSKSGWSATLALARMGESKEIREVIAMVESEEDAIIRVSQLLKDIAYIRQPEGVNLLQRYLESDQKLPSVKDNGIGVGYNQYALDLLTSIILGFPIKTKGLGYSQAEIDTARTWMKMQPDFTIIK